MNNKTLRFIALFGTTIFALKYIFLAEKFEYNQGYSYYTLILTAVGVAFALFIFQRATAKLVSNLDVLVPAGLYITALKGFGFLFPKAFVGFVVQDSIINYSSFTFSIILALAFHICLTTIYAGCQTITILQLVKNEKVDLITTLKNIKEWFPRSLAALIAGSSLVYLFVFALFGLSLIGVGFLTSVWFVYPYIFVVAVLALGWNLLTALLLPSLLESREDIKASIIESVYLCIKYVKKLAIPVVLQMVIIGWVMIFSVTYYEKAEFGDSGGNKTVTTSFESAFIWTGDYTTGSKWNEKLLKTVKSETHKSVDFKLMLLLLLLSIVIKIQIIDTIWGKDDKILASKSDFGGNRDLAIFALGLLVLYMLPFERFISSFEIGVSHTSLISQTSVENNKHFEKELIFEIPKDEMFQVVGNTESIKVDTRGINDIKAAKLAGGVGQEIFILSGKNVLILNEQNKVKKIIDLQLEKPSDGNTLNHFYADGKIVDIDNDGICEFLMYKEFLGSPFGDIPQAVFNQNGEQIWKSFSGDELKKLEDKSDVKLLISGNIDNENLDSLFVFDESGIELFDIERDKDTKLLYSQDFEVFQNEEKLFALNKSGHTIQKNTVDEPYKKSERTSVNPSFIFDSNRNPLTIYFELDELGLFNFDGELVTKYDAPKSEVEYAFFDMQTASYKGDYKVNVFQSFGKQFIPLGNQKPHSAFIARQSIRGGSFSATLYVYDENGKLLLNEMFENATGTNMFVVKDKDNNETLLIENDDKIWRYNKK